MLTLKNGNCSSQNPSCTCSKKSRASAFKQVKSMKVAFCTYNSNFAHSGTLTRILIKGCSCKINFCEIASGSWVQIAPGLHIFTWPNSMAQIPILVLCVYLYWRLCHLARWRFYWQGHLLAFCSKCNRPACILVLHGECMHDHGLGCMCFVRCCHVHVSTIGTCQARFDQGMFHHVVQSHACEVHAWHGKCMHDMVHAWHGKCMHDMVACMTWQVHAWHVCMHDMASGCMAWQAMFFTCVVSCWGLQSESQVPRLDSGSENNNTLFEPLPKVVVQEEVAEPMRGAKKSWFGACVGCVGSRWLQHVSTRIYLNTFFLTNYIRTKNKKTNEIFVVHIFVYQRGVQVGLVFKTSLQWCCVNYHAYFRKTCGKCWCTKNPYRCFQKLGVPPNHPF